MMEYMMKNPKAIYNREGCKANANLITKETQDGQFTNKGFFIQPPPKI